MTQWSGVMESLLAGQDLSEDDAAARMTEIMDGEVDPITIAGFLVALRGKGESGQEIAGFVRAMMDHVAPITAPGGLVDTCGTGGDGHDTFNISTVASLVVAAAGQPVAKHGNRSASSRCGSADLLEGWGVVIDLNGEDVATCIEELGIGFLFARTFHPAMRHVGPVRGALGIRTVFNFLGPLSNPADVAHQVVGVSDASSAPVIAEALARLGRRHAVVFRGSDGMDELTTTGPSDMWEIRDGTTLPMVSFDPASVGIALATLDDLRGGDLAENLHIAERILAGESGPATDIVVLNAGAALYAADAQASIGDGVEAARAALTSGAAASLKDRWVARSQELAAARKSG